MRILQLVHQYMPDYVGGTEFYTRWLSHTLIQRGHPVSIFYRRSAEGVGQDHRLENGVHVWTTWAGLLSPTRRFLATFRAPRITRAFDQVVEETHPDLVHIQHLMGLPAALSHSVQERRIPVVITLHDYWWVCANAQLLTNYSQQVCAGPRAYLNCARCALARADHARLWPALPPAAALLAWRNHLLRQTIQAADRLIAPSEFVRRWYASHGAPVDRLVTIPHGLEYPAHRSPRRRRPDEPLRISYIGGLSWQKGVHVLVEAFRGIQEAGELWIAGDESFDPAYVAELRARAAPGVRFLGRLTRDAVWETLAQVDVVVVPSLWYETFSFIVSEAFAMGIPVVASHFGPLADRARDNVDGLLVPPGNVSAWRATLQRLAREPDLLARLRTNVRPPLTLEEHTQQIEALYTQIVSWHDRPTML